MKKEIVHPGDELGASEEFLPGPGTYEFQGSIFAAVIGELEVDKENMEVKVTPSNPPAVLEPGFKVYALVNGLKEKLAMLEVMALEDKERGVTGEREGVVHISKVRNGFTSNMHHQFRIGDIVKAEVISTKPSLQMTTIAPDLGVVKGYCSRCRQELELQMNGQEKNLYCSNCENSEQRKISSEY